MKKVKDISDAIRCNIKKTVYGCDSSVDLLICAMLAGGHVLIEDVPGLGKTSMAKALAMSVGGSFKRIQFTPDLLPSDLSGIHLLIIKQIHLFCIKVRYLPMFCLQTR